MWSFIAGFMIGGGFGFLICAVLVGWLPWTLISWFISWISGWKFDYVYIAVGATYIFLLELEYYWHEISVE